MITFAADVRDYASAAEYLKRGRHGKRTLERPLANNTRLGRIDADTIGVKYHATVIVTYKRNGHQIIDTGGWNTMTTLQRINVFSCARVYRSPRIAGPERGAAPVFLGGLAVWSSRDKHTPPKFQKCRACHGAGGEYRYETPGGWGRGVSGWNEETGRYESGRPPVVGPASRTWSKCWRCSGEGRADYGSKQIPTRFDEPLELRKDGSVVGFGTIPHHFPAPGDWEKPPGWKSPLAADPDGNVDGSSVTEGLRDAIPGLRESEGTELVCPECENSHRGVTNLVVHLNDTEHWSRERIADHLETLDIDLTFRPLTMADGE